jgi:tetratricopeptide (TPR) repeat protein
MPADLTAALELARGYIATGQRESDPRFIAYAQAILAPWLARAQPPLAALVLEATALQYLHRFEAALALLDRALARSPLDAQAWLTRAALLELQGNYPGARRACAHLTRSLDALVAITCLASVNGRSGALDASYAMLRRVAATDARLPVQVRTWALAVRADLAGRLGDAGAAEADLRAALEIAPADAYLEATYADLLLRLGRDAEVIALLRGAEAKDALLLRLAIAAVRTRSPEGARWAQMYAERMGAAERDGDNTHLREKAMFLLEVRHDARAALAAAAENWRTQREPADLSVYVKAAQQAGSAADRARIAAWLTASGYEDRTVAELRPQARGRGA